MPRYIDAEKFLEDNKEFADREFIHPRIQTTLRDLVDEAPTADGTPVVHAHWTDKEEVYGSLVYRFQVCSNCHTKYDTTTMATCCAFIPSDAFGAEDGKFPKCPVCGAWMDEEVKDDA